MSNKEKSEKTNLATVVALLLAITAMLVACTNISAPLSNIEPSDQPKPQSISFKCVMQRGSWRTVVQRGDKVSPKSLIIWDSTEFGAEHMPEKRCDVVSKHLTNAVADHRGQLKDLYLTLGFLKSLSVVCLVTETQSDCNDSNLLFILNRKNAREPTLVFKRLLDLGNGSSNVPVIEHGIPKYIPLQLLVDRAFE